MLETCKTMGVVACFAVAGFAVGCGGSSSPDETGSGSATAGLTTIGGSDTEGETEESASGASNSASASGTTTATATATASDSATTTDSAGDTNDGPVFDIGSSPDGGTSCGGGGGGGGGGTDFSYIWIANSNEGTISKVNTQTLVEEGRYLVRPDGAGSPSRTSVNLNGDVVVASRNGGATMFAARPEDCPDPLNTSTGPADVKPWPDGCMVWHTPFATDSQRPVAWSQGQFNDATCRYENMKVWTSTHNSNTTTATIYRLNGDTGAIEDQVDATGVQTHVFGLYGAAVDADGNMWASELSVGQLVNVDLETMAIRQWNMPTAGYGMTVDSDGFVWTCSSTVARFDPTTETWQTSAGLSSSGNGCMEDGNGTLWVAADGFVGIDTATLMETQVIPLPARVRGVSFDFEGNIWGPSINSNEAYRVNPVSLVTDTVTGFNYPYTYSDMTGFALSNAGTPSG
jgi:hypothetical protein